MASLISIPVSVAWVHLRRLMAACALLTVTPFAAAGIVVVNNDEWTSSQSAFNSTPDTARFFQNLTKLFAPDGSGKFLAYSDNLSLTGGCCIGGWGASGSALRNTIEGAGHSWTVTTEPELNLPFLSEFDGVFLTDPVRVSNGVASIFDVGAVAQTLEAYVNGGGNVYVQFGTGFQESSNSPGYLAFTERFGLSNTTGFNGLCCLINIGDQHYDYELFEGIGTLFFVNGNWITLTDPANPAARLFSFNGQGLIGVYDPRFTPAPVPLPMPIILIGAPLLSLGLFRRRAGVISIAKASS